MHDTAAAALLLSETHSFLDGNGKFLIERLERLVPW